MKKTIITILLISIILPFAAKAETTFVSPTEVKIESGVDTARLSWQNPTDLTFSQTIIFRSSIPIETYFSFEAVDGLCEKIYEGNGNEFTDTNLTPNLPYYYIFFSKNRFNDYSKAIVKEKQIISTGKTSQNTSGAGLLVNAPAPQVNEVTRTEAGLLYRYNGEVKTVQTDDNSRRLALFIIVKSPNDLTEQDKNAISYFIHTGTPTTILLGSGERAGVLNSYLSVYNKLPTNELEWQDVIKIGNGRWPDERSLESETEAADNYFSAVYKRAPNMEDPHDNAAVTVIAYGLRPAQRNLESEKNAIKIYHSIFNQNPTSAADWDIVRAIAYSGAIR
jgi:hypothetical protein